MNAITVGYFHACAMRIDDKIVCWGWDAYGQLGIGSTENVGKTEQTLGKYIVPADLGAGAVSSKFPGIC